MSHLASVPIPLDIDDVQRIRACTGEIRLEVRGRWLAAQPPSASDEALLVIQIEGRRHRFTPVSGEPPVTPGRWAAGFVVPGWAEPRRDGQAALWIGEAVIPVPPIGVSRRRPASGPPAIRSAVPADPPDGPAAEWASAKPTSETLSEPPSEQHPQTLSEPPFKPPSETPRSGPLADLLLRETVAALHGELEARSAESVRLRSALAGAQSELEARSDSRGALEGTLGELGTELRRLMAAVAEQRGELDRRDAAAVDEREESERREAETGRKREELERRLADLNAQLAAAQASGQRRGAETSALREELAAAQVARDAARGEAAGLRSELERLGAELAATRERVDSETGDLGEANRLLADARALTEQLRARPAGG